MTRSGFLVLALAGAFSSLAFADDTRMGTKAAPTTGPLGPLGVVTSSVSRALAAGPSGPAVDGGDDRRAEIQRALQDLFDFDEMARRALGQHWKSLSTPERDEFVQLFTDAIKQFAVAIVERFSSGQVAFLEEEVAGGYARVRTRVKPSDGAEISIECRLFERGARWAVYDILVDSHSLVANYRSQFASITRTPFALRLLEQMRAEQAARTQVPIAVVTSGDGELLPPSGRERWAAGLLLGAVLYGRRR
jgi:phospholipid transport system substrate-binding protein